MMKSIKVGLWIVLAVAQLAVPAWMIVGEERVLREVRPLKLQTRPVDPADLFRGRYVALGYTLEQVPRERVRGEMFDHGETVYLELNENAAGFAEVVALHKEKPAGELVLAAKVNFIAPEVIGVQLPFDRFYMDEDAAPEAEAAYQAAMSELEQTWVALRVLNGRGVIEDLYISGKPVRQFLREQKR